MAHLIDQIPPLDPKARISAVVIRVRTHAADAQRIRLLDQTQKEVWTWEGVGDNDKSFQLPGDTTPRFIELEHSGPSTGNQFIPTGLVRINFKTFSSGAASVQEGYAISTEDSTEEALQDWNDTVLDISWWRAKV